MGVENLSHISEWAPQDFGRVGPLEVGLLLLIGFALTRPTATPPIRAALVCALLAMALSHARHAQLLGLLAPMLLARPIAAAIGARRPPEPARAVARVALAASLAVALPMAAVRLAEPTAPVEGPSAPISALAAVPPTLRAEPVLNAYGFGGYLIWSGVRPFIDGRADMYGGAMLGLTARSPPAIHRPSRRRSGATGSAGRSSRLATEPSPRWTARPAGAASTPTGSRSCMSATRPRRPTPCCPWSHQGARRKAR